MICIGVHSWYTDYVLEQMYNDTYSSLQYHTEYF